MDLQGIKLLLDTHTAAFKGCLEVMMAQVNNHHEHLSNKCDKIQNKQVDHDKSLEYTQADVDEMKGQLAKLMKENAELKREIAADKDTIMELEQRCNLLDDASRNNNIRIDGLSEDIGETWDQTAVKVSTLIRDTMKIPDVTVERTQRVGRRPDPGSDRRPRPIIARFFKFADRDLVLRNAKLLRGTNIFFNEDLCPASQRIRAEQLPLMRKARLEGRVAFFVNNRLITRESTRPPISSEQVNQGFQRPGPDMGAAAPITTQDVNDRELRSNTKKNNDKSIDRR